MLVLLPLLLSTTLLLAPSSPDALIGRWGSKKEELLALHPERVASMENDTWLWTYEAPDRVRLSDPTGKKPDQVFSYSFNGKRLVITVPPRGEQYMPIDSLAMHASQVQRGDHGELVTLEKLPAGPEMQGRYAETAPKSLGGRYVLAGGRIFYLRLWRLGLPFLDGAFSRPEPIPGANPASFQVLWEHVARDWKTVYCNGYPLKVERASFTPVMNEQRPWFRDRHGLWLGCQRQLKQLPGQLKPQSFDPTSFEVISCERVKDRDGTFRPWAYIKDKPAMARRRDVQWALTWVREDDPRAPKVPMGMECFKPDQVPAVFRE